MTMTDVAHEVRVWIEIGKVAILVPRLAYGSYQSGERMSLRTGITAWRISRMTAAATPGCRQQDSRTEPSSPTAKSILSSASCWR